MDKMALKHLLALFKRLSHVTHFYKDTIPLRDPLLSVRMSPKIFHFNVCIRNMGQG